MQPQRASAPARRGQRGRGWLRGTLAAALLAPLLAVACLGLAAAQPARDAPAPRVRIPNFWDPRAHTDRPDLAGARTIRFLTDDEFPPLHFAGPDGALTGFSVELARAACERLNLTCTVQARRFDTLLDALAESRGDVVAAAVPVDAQLQARFAITQPYFRNPARFARAKARAEEEPSPRALAGRAVGVVADTAHQAFLGAYFQAAQVKPYPDLAAAEAALKSGEVEFLFADGVGLALWVGGAESEGCCVLVGGPYLESRYFGEGLGFILRRDDDALRRALDFALQRLWDEGKYAELYLRFFPISPF